MKIERILCPVDFSECSMRAADDAVDLARTLGAEIHLFHAWKIPPHSPDGASTVLEVMRRTEDDATSKIEALAARHRRGDLRISTRVAEGRAKIEILRMIDEVHADLVVMGTHGRSGLSHVLLGSVAERVVRSAPVPVMTVRLAPST